jgi:hypothetical protein
MIGIPLPRPYGMAVWSDYHPVSTGSGALGSKISMLMVTRLAVPELEGAP